MAIRVMIDGEMVVVPHKPLRKVLAKVNLIRFGVVKNVWDKTFDDYETFGDPKLVEVKAFFKDYCENMYEKFDKHIGIYIWGPNGTGKTMLTSLLVKDAYRKQYSTARITFPEYLEHYTEAWSCRDFDTQQELKYNFMHRWKGVDVLVLDELGKEIETRITSPILEDCLRYREDKGLITVICTNLNQTDFSSRYGESICSLVTGHCVQVELITSDKRLEFKNRRLED